MAKCLSFVLFKLCINEIMCWALAGVAQRTDCRPVNLRVVGSIPSQGTCLGCGLGPSGGHLTVNHTLIFLSLSFSFLSLLYKNKELKSFLKKSVLDFTLKYSSISE